tara:strand:+ start:360 stop:593 length:234 start_codon:yes stop_codon:yes gene_type:complete
MGRQTFDVAQKDVKSIEQHDSVVYIYLDGPNNVVVAPGGWGLFNDMESAKQEKKANPPKRASPKKPEGLIDNPKVKK